MYNSEKMGAECGSLIHHSQKLCAGPSLSGGWLERVEVDAVESFTTETVAERSLRTIRKQQE